MIYIRIMAPKGHKKNTFHSLICPAENNRFFFFLSFFQAEFGSGAPNHERASGLEFKQGPRSRSGVQKGAETRGQNSGAREKSDPQ